METNVSPEWRKALKTGDRVLVVRADDATTVYAGTVHKPGKRLMVRDDTGHLWRVDWASADRKLLWDEERSDLTWMRITCAL